MPDVVIARNKSKEPFKGKYNSVPFVIPAEGEALLDREAAVIWFGDWTTRNIGSEDRLQFRTQEWNRLRGMYGAGFDDPLEDRRIEEPLQADQKWERNKPKIELFDSDGTPIVGVIDDPAGATLPLEGAPAGDITAAMAEMQRQMDVLQSQVLAAKEAQSVSTIQEDDPTTATRRRRGPVAVDSPREDAGG